MRIARVYRDETRPYEPSMLNLWRRHVAKQPVILEPQRAAFRLHAVIRVFEGNLVVAARVE